MDKFSYIFIIRNLPQNEPRGYPAEGLTILITRYDFLEYSSFGSKQVLNFKKRKKCQQLRGEQ